MGRGMPWDPVKYSHGACFLRRFGFPKNAVSTSSMFLLFIHLFLSIYAVITQPPFPTLTHPSLAALSPDHELRKIYPRDFFPNREHSIQILSLVLWLKPCAAQVVRLPLGETTYWLLGPQDGRKVSDPTLKSSPHSQICLFFILFHHT